MADPTQIPHADKAACSASSVKSIILDAHLEVKDVHSHHKLETEMPSFEKTLRGHGMNHRADSQGSHHQQNVPGDFVRYESLKESLTASARTPDEYDAAVRKAAQITGV